VAAHAWAHGCGRYGRSRSYRSRARRAPPHMRMRIVRIRMAAARRAARRAAMRMMAAALLIADTMRIGAPPPPPPPPRRGRAPPLCAPRRTHARDAAAYWLYVFSYALVNVAAPPPPRRRARIRISQLAAGRRQEGAARAGLALPKSLALYGHNTFYRGGNRAAGATMVVERLVSRAVEVISVPAGGAAAGLG
jgi:hypothetical protein